MAKAPKADRKARKPPKQWFCVNGHTMFRYLFVPVKGSSRFDWGCSCFIQLMDKK